MAYQPPSIAGILQNGRAIAQPQWAQGQGLDLSPLNQASQGILQGYAIRRERLKGAMDQLARLGQDALAAGDKDSEAYDAMTKYMPLANEYYGNDLQGPAAGFKQEIPATAGVRKMGTSKGVWDAFDYAEKQTKNPQEGTTKEQWQETLNQLRKLQPGIGEYTTAPTAAKTTYDRGAMDRYFSITNSPEFKQTVDGGYLITTRNGRPYGEPKAMPMTPWQQAQLGEQQRWHNAQDQNMTFDNNLAAAAQAALSQHYMNQDNIGQQNADTAQQNATTRANGADKPAQIKLGEVPNFAQQSANLIAPTPVKPMTQAQAMAQAKTQMAGNMMEMRTQEEIAAGLMESNKADVDAYKGELAQYNASVQKLMKDQGYVQKGNVWVQQPQGAQPAKPAVPAKVNADASFLVEEAKRRAAQRRGQQGNR